MPASRRVLVTGGSSGIGAEVARRFRAAGDLVTVLDRTPPPFDVGFVSGDVTDPDAHEQAVAASAGDVGLDVLVANAGVHDGGLAFGADRDFGAVFSRVLAVNVLGYALAIQAATDALRDASGCVLLTLSDASFDVLGNGAGCAYATSKHALVGLLRTAARDLAPLRVNGVAPGGVPTGLAVAAGDGTQRRLLTDPDGLAERLAGRTLLGRGARLDEVAEAYLFLASPAAGAITGQVLRVDGGRLS